jgi:hypothetical protein
LMPFKGMASNSVFKEYFRGLILKWKNQQCWNSNVEF